MNLKEIQTKKAVEKATLSYLRRGIVPSFSQVSRFVRKLFPTGEIGMPVFRPLFGKKYECSNPDEFNYMIDKIHSDLTDLYDSDNSCNNELLSSFGFYETEKNKVDSMINDALNKLDNVLYGMQEDSSKEFYFENVDDFSKIDFVGNEERGIPPTTAFVDLMTRSIHNNTLTNDSKIPIKDANIELKLPKQSIVNNLELSELKNCLTDSLNECWIQKITTNDNLGITARILVELPRETDVTTVRFQLQSSRKAVVKLTISGQDKQTKILKKVETDGVAEWNFKKTKVKLFIFELSKTEPDAFAEPDYEYYLGAKNISVYNDTHQLKSVLVSKPMKIKKIFGDVALNAMQSIPPDTNTKYFIGLDNLENQISWTKIENKKTTDIGLLKRANINLAKEYTPEFGTKHIKNTYVLGRVDKEPVQDTTKLYVGNQMWENRTLSINPTDEFSMKDLMVKTNPKFIKMDTIDFNHKASTASIYTSYVYCETPKAMKARVSTDSSTSTVSLYTNSIKLDAHNGEYTIRLSAGWNQVQVLYLSSEESVLTIDSYFGNVATYVRAKKDAIREVAVYDLVYNFHRETYDYYSVIEDRIIVNFDPKAIGMEASVEYKYTDNKDAFKNLHIRLMAVLSSNSKDVTPRIENYKLTTL